MGTVQEDLLSSTATNRRSSAPGAITAPAALTMRQKRSPSGTQCNACHVSPTGLKV